MARVVGYSAAWVTTIAVGLAMAEAGRPWPVVVLVTWLTGTGLVAAVLLATYAGGRP